MRRLICVGLLILLSACQAPRLKPFTITDYKNEPPVMLRVSDIRIENESPVYTELPHIESRLPVLPADALRRWIENRFRAAAPDSNNTVTFTIKQATMTQSAKAMDKWYLLDNIEYKLRYKLDVTYSHNNQPLTQTISGWEKRGLPRKKASLADKEAAWQEMMNTLLNKMNDKIIRDIPPDMRLDSDRE